ARPRRPTRSLRSPLSPPPSAPADGIAAPRRTPAPVHRRRGQLAVGAIATTSGRAGPRSGARGNGVCPSRSLLRRRTHDDVSAGLARRASAGASALRAHSSDVVPVTTSLRGSREGRPLARPPFALTPQTS